MPEAVLAMTYTYTATYSDGQEMTWTIDGSNSRDFERALNRSMDLGQVKAWRKEVA